MKIGTYARYFNTSGPNIPAEHYTLPRENLVAQGRNMVAGSRYFTIWAPRQTGKSTFFLLLKTALEKDGYIIIHRNVENYLDATNPFFIKSLSADFSQALDSQVSAETFSAFEDFIRNYSTKKVVLIIDEIEGLNPSLLGQFVHTIRNLYHSRERHCLKSVILVGVSNIVGVVEDNASPFNIADNLAVPFFTVPEVEELLGQHEAATGQLFAPEVKAKIADVTACQPGLVNGFAQQLIERCEGKPRIEMDDYLAVEDWYLRLTIDKNLSNIIKQAKKHQKFVEELLFGENPVRFNLNREVIKTLAVNGVIEDDGQGFVTFKVPLYRKCLHVAFFPYSNGETARISREILISEYLFPDGSLDFPSLIAHYKEYVQRRSFKYFREKDDSGQYFSLKEAALVYSFETFMAAFLRAAGGKSYLEAHTGLGRTDLQIFLNRHEYVVEFKVYGGPAYFTEGKKQLAYYCQKLGLREGEYLVFIPTGIRLPPSVAEGPELVDGVTLRSWLVFYDEEKDF